MNKKKAGELLGKFWEWCPDSEIVDESIYMIDTFMEWLYNEGYEICPREFVSNEVDK